MLTLSIWLMVDVCEVDRPAELTEHEWGTSEPVSRTLKTRFLTRFPPSKSWLLMAARGVSKTVIHVHFYSVIENRF